jgi:hypothetical protein
MIKVTTRIRFLRHKNIKKYVYLGSQSKFRKKWNFKISRPKFLPTGCEQNIPKKWLWRLWVIFNVTVGTWAGAARNRIIFLAEAGAANYAYFCTL